MLLAHQEARKSWKSFSLFCILRCREAKLINEILMALIRRCWWHLGKSLEGAIDEVGGNREGQVSNAGQLCQVKTARLSCLLLRIKKMERPIKKTYKNPCNWALPHGMMECDWYSIEGSIFQYISEEQQLLTKSPLGDFPRQLAERYVKIYVQEYSSQPHF